MTEPTPEVDDFVKAQHDEYSQWVAAGPIYHDGVLAYSKGHPVPASNVAFHHYEEQGLVTRATDGQPADGTTTTPES